jgi:hypothetical protein
MQVSIFGEVFAGSVDSDEGMQIGGETVCATLTVHLVAADASPVTLASTRRIS